MKIFIAKKFLSKAIRQYVNPMNMQIIYYSIQQPIVTFTKIEI